MNIKPLVSICCITYNHGSFVRQCLNGFLMQRCDFDYEILIHDDASTDDTAGIVREYQSKYPELIKPIFQRENQWSQGVRGINPRFNISRAKGKYIALCEGDDYWTDPLKLQKQVDFLEGNPEYSLVVGGFKQKNVDTGEEQLIIKDIPGSDEKGFNIDLQVFFSGWYTKTLTLMFRKDFFDIKEFMHFKYAKDFHLNYLLLKKGLGYYMKEIFGVYHIHTGGVFSPTSQKERHISRKNIYRELYKRNKSDKVFKNKYYKALTEFEKKK